MSDDHDGTDSQARTVLNRSLVPHLRVRYEDMAWLYRQKMGAAGGALIATASALTAHIHAGSEPPVVWTWVGVCLLWLALVVHSARAAYLYREIAKIFTDPADQGTAIWR